MLKKSYETYLKNSLSEPLINSFIKNLELFLKDSLLTYPIHIKILPAFCCLRKRVYFRTEYLFSKNVYIPSEDLDVILNLGEAIERINKENEEYFLEFNRYQHTIQCFPIEKAIPTM